MTAQPLSAAEQARLVAIEAAPAAEESVSMRVANAVATVFRKEIATGYVSPTQCVDAADAALDLLRGPNSDAEQAVARVAALACELGTRYPDAPPELQSILNAVAADIRTTIADALRGGL